jgi:hypothetical protein
MSPDTLLAGIRDGNFHWGGIRCLRLFRVERELSLALRQEALRLCRTERSSDVCERQHVTNWTRPTGAVQQFSLLNRGGHFDDYRDDHDLSCVGKQFHHAARYPYLARFIGIFPHAINFRLNVLGAGAGLSPHEEHSLFLSQAGTPAVRARFHLPLYTSRAAWMSIEGDVHRFVPRTIYYFNQGCIHAAANPSREHRIHLVWDLLLTMEVFELMFSGSAPPPGLRRIPPASRSVPIRGRISVRDYARLPPLVTPREAGQVSFSPVQ